MKLIASIKPSNNMAKTVFACAVLLLVGACDSGGGSGATDSSGLIIGESTGGDASLLSDKELLQSAFDTSDAALSTNLGNLASLPQDDDNDQDTPVVIDTTDPTDPQDEVQADPDNSLDDMLSDEDMEPVDTLDEDTSSFLLNTLGLDESGSVQASATISREGNVVTVRPDADEVCADEIPLADELNDNVDTCRELVNDLSVEVNALTTESGIITYLFDSSPVLLIGYSTTGVSYEVKLDGLRFVLERNATLNNLEYDTTTQLSGAFRLTATIINDDAGSEAGELSLEVSEPVSAGSSDSEESFTLQNSTVFRIQFDQATDDISIAVDWGALQLISRSGDDQGNSELSDVELGGLSATFDANTSEAGFALSGINIGNGLTITIGNAEAARLNLAQFGVSVDEEGVVMLDGALNANLVLDNLSGWLDEFATNYSYQANLSATDGATASELDEDGIYLIESGELSSEITVSGDNADGISQNQSSSVSAMEDQCIESNNDDEDSEQPIAVVVCP